jgi:hypothetical protein
MGIVTKIVATNLSGSDLLFILGRRHDGWYFSIARRGRSLKFLIINRKQWGEG